MKQKFDIENEGKVYPHLWKVIEVVPGRKLTLDWKYAGYQGDSKVEFLLTPENGGTRLTLTQTGQESFPQDDPIFSRETGVAGWTYFIQDSLKKFLEK